MYHTFQFKYEKITYQELNESLQKLINDAISALKGSYSPYSNYRVGAAILLQNGKIITGSNQENSSFPCTTCAERSALNYSQSAYPETAVEYIAIVAQKEGNKEIENFISPCGLCRQALLETERKQKKHIKVLLVCKDFIIVIESIQHLLPFAF